MSPDIIALLAQVPLVGIFVFVLFRFLKFLREKDKLMWDREMERDKQLVVVLGRLADAVNDNTKVSSEILTRMKVSDFK